MTPQSIEALEAEVKSCRGIIREYEETLMQIGEELGLDHVTAFNCLDAIRDLKGRENGPNPIPRRP